MRILAREDQTIGRVNEMCKKPGKKRSMNRVCVKVLT
jgi:hypothetical protein